MTFEQEVKSRIVKSDKDGRSFDKYNNAIYYNSQSGYEAWMEYDKNRNITHFKDSRNNENWKEYDDNSNLTYYRDESGSEEYMEYNENNRKIYHARTYVRDFNPFLLISDELNIKDLLRVIMDDREHTKQN